MLETVLEIFMYTVQTCASKALIILDVISIQCGGIRLWVGFGQEEGYFRNFNPAELFDDESSLLECRWIHTAKWSVNPGSLESVAPKLSCEGIVGLHDCDVYRLGGGRWCAVTPQNSLLSCLIFEQIYWWDSHCYGGKKKIFCSICHIWKLNFIAIFWEMGCTFKIFCFCFLFFFWMSTRILFCLAP